MAASSSAKFSHFEPSRVLPERRLPADLSLPGQRPAHDARCRAVVNWVMSVPISPMMHCTPRRWMPVIVHTSSTAGLDSATRPPYRSEESLQQVACYQLLLDPAAGLVHRVCECGVPAGRGG